MQTDINRLIGRVSEYKKVLENTNSFRLAWKDKTKAFISDTLQTIIKETGLKASVTFRNNIENLEAVVLDLGRSSSGIAENLENTDLKRTMVKNNGALVYQQLFNGKIMVMLVSPQIEGYGDAKPPLSLEILRPGELSANSIYGHAEALLNDITEWEDYDDDNSNKKLAFQPIGFQHTLPAADGPTEN